MTTANIISIVRICMIPVFMVFALLDYNWTAAVIFAIASLTDGVDGYIARKYNQITTLGKFLDPLADKLLVTAALMVLVEKGMCGSVPAFIIIARELLVTSLRIVAMGEGIVIAAQKSGKWKTFIQIVGILFLFTPFAKIGFTPFPGVSFMNLGTWSMMLSTIVIWIMVAITIISGIEYFKNFGGSLKAGVDKK